MVTVEGDYCSCFTGERVDVSKITLVRWLLVMTQLLRVILPTLNYAKRFSNIHKALCQYCDDSRVPNKETDWISIF